MEENVSYDPRQLRSVSGLQPVQQSFAEGDRIQLTAPAS
jgi:hypothetical protein